MPTTGITRPPLLPAASWDTHVHIFDSNLGSFASGAAYTPAQAPLSDLLDFQRSVTREGSSANLVLVQPSPYGTDNSILLKTLEQLVRIGHPHARGIAVVDVEIITDDELWALHRAGVRGLRLNKMASQDGFESQTFCSEIRHAADRIKRMPGWKLQIFVSGKIWDDIYETVLSLPVIIIADHIGGMAGVSRLPADQKTTQQPGYQSLLKLAQQGRVLIKISGLYRLSSESETGYADLEPVIGELAAKVPDRLIYASDWPHTGDGSDRGNRRPGQVEEFRKVDNQLILANIKSWIGEETWEKMMVTTPASAFL
ncbi:hypothetical protein F5X68DRAFT_137281 [Plectosphaerella plurivora]|uniref:Amidohydrolase-related domain-containing protein n=1 Tax=Plectosphaerella plurivora TaxID=936078 RepID=A0A9P8V848_9PEZI|nr:hypothetical protein F5X68DRAFT_137281 [Plectosphaerella plurivora]